MTTGQRPGLAEIFDRKWTVLVLWILRKQSTRFNVLQRAQHGVSQKILTATLRRLERDGFMSRTIYPTVPPKVEYALTDLGWDPAGCLVVIRQFATDNSARIDALRERFDRQADTRSEKRIRQRVLASSHAPPWLWLARCRSRGMMPSIEGSFQTVTGFRQGAFLWGYEPFLMWC